MPTMRALSTIAVSLLFAAACRPAPVPGTVYGERPTLTDTTRVSAILDSPQVWLGKRVLVAGTAVEVCEERGCWLQLSSDREHQTIKVKVEDGVIIFPMSARGHRAVVEGVVEMVALAADAARAQARKHAGEMGLPFDSTAVYEATTTYQLRGTGAFIED
jgi:hypothetical protein